MSVYDYFNYGAGAQLGVQPDYNQQQFNTQGESLAPTPPANNVPVANDYSNDQRTAQDYKQQARQAQIDTMGAQNTDGKYVFKDGYMMDKTPDDRVSMGRNAAMAYMTNYLANMGDQNQAIAAGAMGASNAVAQHDARLKREGMLSQLESTGRYNSLDMAKWAETGDTKDLIANQGTWTSDGNGFMHNTLTGESKRIEGYQDQKKLTQVDTGDEIHFVNDAGETIKVLPKNMTPEQKAEMGVTGSGGGIGLDEDESHSDTPAKVNGVYGTYDNKHNFKPLGEKEQAYWRDRESAGESKGDANTQLVDSDLKRLSELPDSEIENFTGHTISKSSVAQDSYAEFHGKDAQANLAASKRLSTQLGNSAIAAAKAAGASGINTEAELKRFTAGVPQVRYSSVEDYKQSLKEIQEYTDNFKASLLKGKGVKTTANKSTDQMSDEELLATYTK
ncbi:hypothetical protein OH773_06705 [Buttiauxella sp. WJP83]|uniref:hypothetical protein n=1 Tax=Buttiauxella sp. WJP83 TaxID=2986951 RepID=UPI0022DDD96B|nr:hypothetical protein [Buttiauxella sp. WJP83]WBM71925.1 hypothetical protein OH773_06705 [Buttiauxella sp. WJP83]